MLEHGGVPMVDFVGGVPRLLSGPLTESAIEVARIVAPAAHKLGCS